MKVRKAVFPVAGLGTRFLPATKANPKEMLPVVDKPLIQYAAEEAVNAGIEVLIFVTGRNKRSIPDHFDKAYELETELESKAKHEMLDVVRNIVPPEVSCIYMRQAEALGLGHAVLCAKEVVGNDPFAVILADDLIDDGGKGCLSQMVEVFNKHQCGVIGVEEVAENDVSNYGVVAADPMEERLWNITGIVEKPRPEDAPSNMAVVGRYVLEASIFEILESTPRGSGNEIQLTDAIAAQLHNKKLRAYAFKGKRFDCGNKLGYLQATVEYGMKHHQVGEAFRAYIKETLC